jgi:NarL family two-component system response regulator LiaR
VAKGRVWGEGKFTGAWGSSPRAQWGRNLTIPTTSRPTSKRRARPGDIDLIAPHECPAWTAIVVDHDALARRAMADVLRRAGILVVAEAADGADAIELARRHRPDVVLMEVALPSVDGIAATRRIVRERPEQVVVLLADSEDDDLGVLALRHGAAGFLSKEVGLEALPRAIKGAARGEAAVSRTLAARMIAQLRLTAGAGAGLRPVHSPLTQREWEVLDLMCEGQTTDEMADAFVVSAQTIRWHVKHILHKLGVNSRAEAVAVVRRMRGES